MLLKHETIPSWITHDLKTSFAFFAGYIDAEGYFYFQGPKNHGGVRIAEFGIQTQDKIITHQLGQKLEEYGIKTRGPYISHPAGRVDKKGTRNNKDMWRIQISRKRSLWKLVHFLQPHIKHGAKIKRIKKVRENLILRNSAPHCRPINLAVPELTQQITSP